MDSKNLLIICLVGLFAISFFNFFQYAQAVSAPDARWEKTFFSRFDRDVAPLMQTDDKGYLIVGAGTWGDQVAKFNQDGGEVWNKTFDGTFLSIQQTSDNEFILAGHKVEIDMFDASNSYYVVKLLKIDTNGEKTLEKSYSKSDYIIEGLYACQTSDEGYIIVGKIVEIVTVGGFAIPDVWLIKTDFEGNIEWNKTYGGRWNDTLVQVLQTDDNGYIMVGYTDSYGVMSSSKDNLWLVKTDSYGNEQWNKTFGDTGEDVGCSIQQTSDNGYIIVGYTRSYGASNGDVWLIKTDSSGNEQWNKTYNRKGDDRGYSVLQTIDEGYVMAGVSYYTDGDVWVIKTDSNGNMVWNKTYGGNDPDRGYSIQETIDDGYIISGRTFPSLTTADIMLIKLGGNADNQYPTSDAGGSYSGFVAEDIIFDASNSRDSDGEIKYYRWDWNNDGIWDTDWLVSPTVENTYYDAGSFTVMLEVKDDDGGTNTAVASVVVESRVGSNEGEKKDTGTPGFEIVLVIIAILITSLIWKRSHLE